MVEALDKTKWRKSKSIGWSMVQVFKVRHIHNKMVSDKGMVLLSFLSFVFVQGHEASKWHIFDTQLEGFKSWLHPMADPHLAFVESLLRYLVSLCSLLIIVKIQDWTAFLYLLLYLSLFDFSCSYQISTLAQLPLKWGFVNVFKILSL